MVEVKMSGAEYMELIEMKRELVQLKQAILDSFELSADNSGFRIRRRAVLTPELKKQVASKVVAELKAHPETLKTLYQNGEPIIDLQNGWTNSYWGRLEDNQYDIRTDKEIQEMWKRWDADEEREEELD